MTNVQIDASIAKNADGSVSVEAAQEALVEVGAALVKKATGLNLAGNVATLYRHDPLTAESQLRDILFGLARTILTDAFTALDDHGKTVKVEGKTYRKAAPTSGRAMTLFGPVDFLRSIRTSPSSRCGLRAYLMLYSRRIAGIVGIGGQTGRKQPFRPNIRSQHYRYFRLESTF